MHKIQCIGGPMDGGYLEFEGKIPNLYRFPCNVERVITDLYDRHQAALDRYMMAEYSYNFMKEQFIFKDYV